MRSLKNLSPLQAAANAFIKDFVAHSEREEFVRWIGEQQQNPTHFHETKSLRSQGDSYSTVEFKWEGTGFFTIETTNWSSRYSKDSPQFAAMNLQKMSDHLMLCGRLEKFLNEFIVKQ